MDAFNQRYNVGFPQPHPYFTNNYTVSCWYWSFAQTSSNAMIWSLRCCLPPSTNSNSFVLGLSMNNGSGTVSVLGVPLNMIFHSYQCGRSPSLPRASQAAIGQQHMISTNLSINWLLQSTSLEMALGNEKHLEFNTFLDQEYPLPWPPANSNHYKMKHGKVPTMSYRKMKLSLVSNVLFPFCVVLCRTTAMLVPSIKNMVDAFLDAKNT